MTEGSPPRPIGACDLALLAEMHRAIFTAPWDQAWSVESLAQTLAVPGIVGWILERNSMPVGFVLARFTLDEGEILLTGVLPEARGKGHGARLMQAVVAAAREAGLTRLFLEHAEPNVAAAALYRRFGFAPIGRRRGYYTGAAGDRHDAVTLALELLAPNSINPS